MATGEQGYNKIYTKILEQWTIWNFSSKYTKLFAQVSDIGPSWSSCFFLRISHPPLTLAFNADFIFVAIPLRWYVLLPFVLFCFVQSGVLCCQIIKSISGTLRRLCFVIVLFPGYHHFYFVCFYFYYYFIFSFIFFFSDSFNNTCLTFSSLVAHSVHEHLMEFTQKMGVTFYVNRSSSLKHAYIVLTPLNPTFIE